MKPLSFLLLAAGALWAEDWPGFRGPARQGISAERKTAADFAGRVLWVNRDFPFTLEEGEITVVETGTAMKEIARNPMEGKIRASPAVSGGRIFIRTEQSLFAIGGRQP